MTSQNTSHPTKQDNRPSLPMDQETWQAIAVELELSPQQIRIVELMLQGKPDKEIASELGISIFTVQTYNKRIFSRVDVRDRLSLVLHIFAMAQKHLSTQSCNCKQ